jgi:hypothetical protein
VVRRLAWLTALALLASCGGDPAPEVENPASVKRKNNKNKKKNTTEVADASEDAPKKKKKSDDPEEKRRQQEEEDAREAEERRERIRKREAEEAKEAEEAEAVASDEGGDSSEDEEAKAEEKKAKAEEKKRKKEEAAEEAKRKKEELAEKKKAAAEEKKAAAEEKKRKKEEEAEAKKEAEAEKKKKKKGREEVEEESSDEEEVAAKESDEEEETKKDDKKSSKKDKAKAKKTVAAKETAKKDSKKKKEEAEDEEEPEKEEKEVAEANIDMEEDEGSGLPPPDPENESKELDLEGGTPQRDLGDDTDVAPPMLAIDRRPLTQPKGKLDLHGGLRVAAITTTGAMGASSTATSEGLGLGATYGVSNKLQVSFDYTIGINPGSIKGPFALSAAFRVKESEKLDIALSGGLAVDFISTTDPMTMMTTDVTLKALQFGIWTRYHLGAKASVFTGLPALPNASGGLSGAAGLPPLPYHLSLGLGQGATIALEVPVGVGYQASPKLYAMAMTSLAHIDMKNSTGAFLFADYIPFTVGGFYAKDAKLDIGAVLSDDVKQGLGYLRFDIVARYYLK